MQCELCTHSVLCCDLIVVIFTHTLLGYFTGTAACIWLSQCQWSKPEEYDKINHIDSLGTRDMTTAWRNITNPCTHFMGDNIYQQLECEHDMITRDANILSWAKPSEFAKWRYRWSYHHKNNCIWHHLLWISFILNRCFWQEHAGKHVKHERGI